MHYVAAEALELVRRHRISLRQDRHNAHLATQQAQECKIRLLTPGASGPLGMRISTGHACAGQCVASGLASGIPVWCEEVKDHINDALLLAPFGSPECRHAQARLRARPSMQGLHKSSAVRTF